MTQKARRVDPYPWTWEVPVGTAFALLPVLVFGAHAGRSIANLTAGAGWRWPARVDLFSSLPGLLFHGDAHSGLRALADPIASPATVWGWIIVVEILIVALAGLALKPGMVRWGPGRMRGMASRSEAEKLLGRTRLYKHRTIVRPDLYGQDGLYKKPAR